jgi:hypothetical protein
VPPFFWYRTQGFLKSKTLVEPSRSSTTGTFSPFRTLRKASAVHVRWTEHDSYLSFSQKSSSWHFLALAKLCGTAQVGNHQRISNSWIKVDCCLSYDSFLAHTSLQGDSAAFLATNASQRDLQSAWSSPFKVLLSLRKVIRFRNFLCTWLPRRLKSCRSRYFKGDWSLRTQILVNQKRNSWLRAHGTLPSGEPPSRLKSCNWT